MVSPANSKRSALSPRTDFLGFITGFNRAVGMLCSSKQIARLRFWEKNGENIIEHLMSNLLKFSKLQHCRLGHTFSGASRLQLRPGILHSLTHTALRPRSARSHGPGLGSGHGRQRHLVLRNTLKVFPNLGRAETAETDHTKVSHEVISLPSRSSRKWCANLLAACKCMCNSLTFSGNRHKSLNSFTILIRS